MLYAATGVGGLTALLVSDADMENCVRAVTNMIRITTFSVYIVRDIPVTTR